MPSLYEIKAEDIETFSDDELLLLHNRAHKAWADVANAANDYRMARLIGILLNVHRWIVGELGRRGIEHPVREPRQLDEVAKVKTDFGEFTRPAPAADKYALMLTDRDIKRIQDGIQRKVAVSATNPGVAKLPPAKAEMVLASKDFAWGIALLGFPPERVSASEFDQRTNEHGINRFERIRRFRRDDILLIPILSFMPWVNPVPIERVNGRLVIEPGTLRYLQQPLEKQADRKAVLAFVFNRADEVLLVKRRFPPVVWGPPGGFVREGEDFEEAAIRETLEETGVEIRHAFYMRSGAAVGMPDVHFVCARAVSDQKPKPTYELLEARWVPIGNLIDFRPLSPGRGQFRRALNDLIAFEAARAREKVIDIPVRNITARLLATLPTNVILELDDTLHERFETFARLGSINEDILNAHLLILDELESRGVRYQPKGDTLDKETEEFRRRFGKRTGDPNDAAPAWLNTERAKNLFEQLPNSVVVLPQWACLTGSYLYGDPQRQPNDIDVIFRQREPVADNAALKLQRAIKELTGLNAQFILEPAGPNWSYMPLYDLVAIKRPEWEIEVVHEDFARFVKQTVELETDSRRIKPGVPFAVYKAAGEVFLRNVETAVEEWAGPAFAEGKRIICEPKADGFRIIFGRAGDRFFAFTEGGRDRAPMMPELANWAMKVPYEFIVDAEFVPMRDADILPRQEGIALIVGKTPPADLRFLVLVHDCIWAKPGLIADRPFIERRESMRRIIPEEPTKLGAFTLQRMPSFEADNPDELLKLTEGAAKMLSAEGAMWKRQDFRYEFGKRLKGVLKVKRIVEVSIAVIGWRKVPAPKPPHEKWSRKEALQNLPKQLAKSRTYVVRGAIVGPDGELMPIEAARKLAPKDVEIDWDEERQVYTGTDDPKLWRMCPGWPHRKVSERAYGVTYAFRWDPPGPKCGMIVDVAPAAVQVLTDPPGLAWTFPKVRNLAPEKKEPGAYERILEAFEILRPEIVTEKLSWLAKGIKCFPLA